MGCAVDDAGCGDGNPSHLQRPNGHARHAKQRQVDDHHQRHTLPGKTRVKVVLNPIIGCAVAIAGQGFQVFRFLAVQLSALQQHGFDAVNVGAVWIFGLLTLGVVFAVDGGPFLRHLAGGQPKPETKKMRSDRVQIEGAVRLVAVQVDGDAGDGDVCHHQRSNQDLPPSGIRQSVGQPLDQTIPNSGQKACIRCNHCFPLERPRGAQLAKTCSLEQGLSKPVILRAGTE